MTRMAAEEAHEMSQIFYPFLPWKELHCRCHLISNTVRIAGMQLCDVKIMTSNDACTTSSGMATYPIIDSQGSDVCFLH